MTARLLVVACAIALAAPVARQTRDGAAPVATPNAATGRMTGTITDETSGAPLGGAVVMLTGAGLKRAQSAVTDLDGHFAIGALPAGSFLLTVSKTAYVPMAYGAKAYGRQGVAIALAAGADVRDINVRLPRGAVITGTVRDQDGAPIPDAVVAINRTTSSIRPPSAITDDRGVYRVFGLPPGSYLVSAQVTTSGLGDATIPSTVEVDRMLAELQRSAGVTASPAATAAASSPPEGGTYSFVPVFYPNTTDSGEAQIVTLAAAEERTIDFSVGPARTSTIEGSIRTADGSPPPSVSYSLSSPNPVPPVSAINTSAQVSSLPGGRFLFSGVTPGHYVIRIRSSLGRVGSPPSELYWADQPITVTGDPISGLSLVLQPSLHFAGKLVFDGASPPPADLQKVAVTLTAPVSLLSPGSYSSPAAMQTLSGNASADGTFDMHNIVPGQYVVGATTASSWRLVSAIVNGHDAADTPLEFTAGDIAGATLRFVDRHVTLSGTLEAADRTPTSGYVVIALPADRALWRPRSRRIQSTRPASDGKYAFHDLPAGEYLIAALTDVSADDLADVSFLADVAPSAIKVTLRDDADTLQNLRIAK